MNRSAQQLKVYRVTRSSVFIRKWHLITFAISFLFSSMFHTLIVTAFSFNKLRTVSFSFSVAEISKAARGFASHRDLESTQRPVARPH